MELGISFSSLFIGVILAAIVLGFHVYLHLRKHGREFLLLRTLLLLVGLLGLLMLFFKPTLDKISPSKNITLATEANENLITNNSFKSATSVHEILNSPEQYDTIIITGNGLSESDLKLLDSFNLKFIPSNKTEGFVAIDFPIAKEKETWVLSGILNQSKPREVRLKLSDGKVLETESDQEGNFSFKVNSRSSGHFTYQLSVFYPDTTITENLPVKILPSQKWNLLALSSSPSFELNYLKNYWVKLGNGFTLKQKVSNERYKETFLNNPKIALDKINNQTLNKFNFLLIDTKSWNDLKETAQQLILNYVAAGRIGLLLMDIKKGDILKRLNYVKISDEQEIILDNSNIKISQTDIPKGFRGINANKIKPAAIRSYGLGSIGVMTIPETYRFILANENTIYQNLWAKIFSELYIAPSEDVVFKSPKWNWGNADCQINIYSRSDIEETGVLNATTEIHISKTKDQVGMYSASVKPNDGWNTFQINANKSIHKFYSHTDNSWQAMKQAQLHSMNLATTSEIRNIPPKENHETQELPFYWGLILSLLGLGSLWLHERIYS